MIVTITGRSCTGKTTLGRELASRLGYEFVSIGELYRNSCTGAAMDDDELDAIIAKELKEKSDLVIEGRMAGAIFNTLCAQERICGKSVYVEATPGVQMVRYMKRTGCISFEEAVNQTLVRDASDQDRLQGKYGIDIFRKDRYDVVINTDSCDVPTIVSSIIEQLGGDYHD